MFITFKDGVELDVLKVDETYNQSKEVIIIVSVDGTNNTISDIVKKMSDETVSLFTLTTDFNKQYTFEGFHIRTIDRSFEDDNNDIVILLTDKEMA